MTLDDKKDELLAEESASREFVRKIADDLLPGEATEEEVTQLAGDLYWIHRADVELRAFVKAGTKPSARTQQRDKFRSNAEAWAGDFAKVIAYLKDDAERVEQIFAANCMRHVTSRADPGRPMWTNPWDIFIDLHTLYRAEHGEFQLLDKAVRSRKPRPVGFDVAALKRSRDRAKDRAEVYGRAAEHVRTSISRVARLLMGVRGSRIGPGPLVAPGKYKDRAGLIEDLTTLLGQSELVQSEVTTELSGRSRDVDTLLVERVWQALCRHGIRPTAEGTGKDGYAGGNLVHACGALRGMTTREILKKTWVTRIRDEMSARQCDPKQRDSRLTDDSLRRAVVEWVRVCGGVVEGAGSDLFEKLMDFVGDGDSSPVGEPMWPANPRAFAVALGRIAKGEKGLASPIRLRRHADVIVLEVVALS